MAWSRAVSLRVGAPRRATISRVAFPNRRGGVIGLAFAGKQENDGHLSPWQEAVGHEIIPETHEYREFPVGPPGCRLVLTNARPFRRKRLRSFLRKIVPPSR